MKFNNPQANQLYNEIKTYYSYPTTKNLANFKKLITGAPRNVFLETSEDGVTFLHLVIYHLFTFEKRTKKIEEYAANVIEILFSRCFETFDKELFLFFLLTPNDMGFTPVLSALKTGSSAIYKKLQQAIIFSLKNAKWISIIEYKDLYTFSNINGYTGLFEAIISDNAEILTSYLNIILQFHDDKVLTDEELSSLLLKPNKADYNILHAAVKAKNKKICEIFLQFFKYVYLKTKDVINKNDIKKLVLARNSTGFSPFLASCAPENRINFSPILQMIEDIYKAGIISAEDYNRCFNVVTPKGMPLVYHLIIHFPLNDIEFYFNCLKNAYHRDIISLDEYRQNLISFKDDKYPIYSRPSKHNYEPIEVVTQRSIEFTKFYISVLSDAHKQYIINDDEYLGTLEIGIKISTDQYLKQKLNIYNYAKCAFEEKCAQIMSESTDKKDIEAYNMFSDKIWKSKPKC